MIRSTRMVTTHRGPMLFSPVPANQLMRGDLVVLPSLDIAERLTAVSRSVEPGREVRLSTARSKVVGDEFVGLNEPVLRAVGARAAGIL